MSTLKYLRAMIKLGNLGLEVFQAPDGSYRLSQTQVLQAIGISKNWISIVTKRGDESLKTLRVNGFTGVKESASISLSSGGTSTANTLSVDDSILIWLHFAMQRNNLAISLLEQIRESDNPAFLNHKKLVLPNNKKAKSLKKKEACCSDRLAAKLNGFREVVTEAGRIDVLTSVEVIEVKTVKDWKGAIGQVIAYGFYYPSHQKRIHLFGEADSSFKVMVEKHCHKLGISVTWELTEAVRRAKSADCVRF